MSAIILVLSDDSIKRTKEFGEQLNSTELQLCFPKVILLQSADSGRYL